MQHNQNNMHSLINNTKLFIVQQRKATTSIIFRYVCETFQRYRSIGLENRQTNTIKKSTFKMYMDFVYMCVCRMNAISLRFKKKVCSWIRANLSMFWCICILYCSALKFKFRAKIAPHFVAN